MSTHPKNQKVGFLLGAGVSLPCGAPTTVRLTEQLTQQEMPYVRGDDGRYRLQRNYDAAATATGVPQIHDVQRLLHHLRQCVDAYYSDRVNPVACPQRTVNYEDLAYLCVQVLETLNRNRDNPAVGPFVHDLANELKITEDALYDTAREALNLISDHLLAHLSNLSPAPGHIACLRDACTALGPGAVPVLSLNYDCLIEQALQEARIPVNDMLRVETDGRRILDVALQPDQVNLCKLHGSINWYRWRPVPRRPRHDRWDRWIGALSEERMREAWNCDDRPVTLIGRFNKELDYAGAPFTELFAAARSALRDLPVLVVSGYSFGDKAVNTMIVDWIYAAPKGRRRIVVAHAEPHSLREGSRDAMGNKWEGWTDAGVLIEMPKFLSNLSWDELRDRIEE